MKSLYKIVIVGRPNDGKSSIFANFLGDDAVAVSPIPGETKRQSLREINLGGAVVEVVDTPGLQHPETVFFKFKEYAESGRNPASAFAEEFADPRYAHDVEIMKALAGADICMIVVNADNFFAHTQKCLLDTFSMLGSKTVILGLINRSDADFIGEWRGEFASRGIESFEFDAFKTKFKDCAMLFERICSSSALRARSDLGGVLHSLKENRESLWKSNISAAAGEILNSLKDLMEMRVEARMSAFSLLPEERERLFGDFSKRVSRFAASFRGEILRRFKYSGLRLKAADFAPEREDARFIVPNFLLRAFSMLPLVKKPRAFCAANPKSGFPVKFVKNAAAFVRTLVSFSYAQSATRECEVEFSGNGGGVLVGEENILKFASRAAGGDESDSFYELQGSLKEELARAIMQP
ncbi:MAG: 50S ribosome-binding GTPase [Opitutales bacterium]|nr:50S ribosome-binding GTPase [Opitutales bacterium]